MLYDDIFFRNLVAPFLIAFLAFGVAFRARTHTSEKLDRMQEGWAVLVLLRLSGLLTWIAVGVWLWNPANLAWARLELPDIFRFLGLAVGVCAIAWLMWMFRSLGRNLTDTVVTRKDAYLVTSGPYRLVRHPMYVGVFLLSVFLALVMSNWLVLILGMSVFGMMCVRLPIEERNLIARFGDGYRAYMRTTGRFWPRIAG